VIYRPQDGRWEVSPTKGMPDAKSAFSPEKYRNSTNSLKEFLCQYFSSGDCNEAMGDAISPMGGLPGGWKILKVRWALPGSGKSGSLRLVLLVHCELRRVHVAEAFVRKDDPKSSEVMDAARNAKLSGD
jgi:hypothetical protein